jgi:pimeloyl-ACP methyl ester carboxylesterase
VIHVKDETGGTRTATMDSPDEGLEALTLGPFVLDKEHLSFDLKISAARFEGKLNPEGTEAAGTWKQRGVTLPLTFRRTETPTPVPRIVGPEQIWEGRIGVGPGMSLRIVFHVGKAADGKLMARMDSPDQGARGLKVDAATVDASSLVFELKSLSARYEGKLNAEGTEAAGTWSQGGAKLPLTLKKTTKVAEVRRPQTPKPPFPYRVIDVSYPNAKGGVTLAGTLTEPEGPGPFPAAILISGSGAQDRDETLFEHKPFLVLADTLTRRGIAVLRVDDRGVGGSTGSIAKSTSDDFAGDVLASVDYLRNRGEIDGARIGLIGHSEGGIIAPLAATRDPRIAFIVLMAGTGLPGEEILYLQGQLILKAAGADEKALKSQLDLQKALFAILRTEADEKAMEKKMQDAVKATTDALPEDQRKALAGAQGLIEAQLKMVRSPWFRYFLSYDPRPTLGKVRCPVLALVGEKDLQVPPRENLAQIESALKAGGNARVTIKELPGLNHLFQTCKTGAPAEYAQIEETLAPSALGIISDWIGEQVKRP